MKHTRKIEDFASSEAIKLRADKILRLANRTADGCLECAGKVGSRGYAMVTISQKQWLVHRVVWTSIRGPIPVDKWLLHSCDNRRCINVNHLRLGTASENNADCVSRGRWAWGKNKTKLTPEKIVEIKQRYAGNESQYSIADSMGVTQGQISNVVNGKRWKFIK